MVQTSKGRWLVKLKLIIHICRILRPALAVHLARVVALHSALLVASERIARQVRVLVVQIALRFVCLLRSGSLV